MTPGIGCAEAACPYRIVRHRKHRDLMRKPTALRVLDAMVASWRLDRTTPSYRSLMNYVGLKSTGDVHYHVKELERAGLVALARGRHVYVPTNEALRRHAA